MSYNGYTNWETWNTFNYVSSQYDLIKTFENNKVDMETFKEFIIDFIKNVSDNIDINKIDFDNLYDSVYSE